MQITENVERWWNSMRSNMTLLTSKQKFVQRREKVWKNID